MDTDAGRQLERIRKYSRGLQRLCRFFLAVMLVAACGTLVILLSWSGSAETQDASALRRFIDLNGIVFDWAGAPIAVRVLSAVYLTTIYAAVMKLVHHASKLFGLYANGDIFTTENVREFRLIGIMMVLVSLTWVIVLPIPYMLAEPPVLGASAPGPAMSVNTEIVSPFFLGLMIIFMSWVMDSGRRLREENDLVV